MTRVDTKQRILDVAEVEFADHGYAAASLRRIIGAAGVNLAAVHYHFKSKEGLLEAVLLRRAGPLNEERLRLLDRSEAKAGKAGASIEQIIEAFIGPPMRLVLSPGGEGRAFGKLVGRLHAESGDHFFPIMKKHFASVSQRFRGALRKACPKLPDEELFWRIYCVAGAMSHTLTHWHHLEAMSGGVMKTNNVEVAIERMVRFLAAGFRVEPKRKRK